MNDVIISSTSHRNQNNCKCSCATHTLHMCVRITQTPIEGVLRNATTRPTQSLKQQPKTCTHGHGVQHLYRVHEPERLDMRACETMPPTTYTRVARLHERFCTFFALQLLSPHTTFTPLPTQDAPANATTTLTCVVAGRWHSHTSIVNQSACGPASSSETRSRAERIAACSWPIGWRGCSAPTHPISRPRSRRPRQRATRHKFS